jgi:hypothetical protein
MTTSFIPASELVASDAASAAGLPRGCTFSETDWRALAPFWYPVAFSHAITDKPYTALLLDAISSANTWLLKSSVSSRGASLSKLRQRGTNNLVLRADTGDAAFKM